ncbi:hypothetical protein DV735_g1014, partial [Chaetothyriales sp. CBS 134920]
MQGFNFGIGRKSVADSIGAASSVYSPPPSTAAIFSPTPLQAPFEEEEEQGRGLNGTLNGAVNGTPTEQDSSVNMNDPVAMHLLTETAINDSSNFQVLSFDEVALLKKERGFLKQRVEATRRKLALETKMRDAAHSLNRLYASAGARASPEPKAGGEPERPTRRRTLRGAFRASNDDPQSLADGEYSASRRKVQELSQELIPLEKRLAACEQRLLEHTAAILQLSHKNAQKNGAQQSLLPHSPESMMSQARSGRRGDGLDDYDFDERSLYHLSDSIINIEQNSKKKTEALGQISQKLDVLAQRLHAMADNLDAPPQPTDERKLDGVVEAQIVYIEQGLDAIAGTQARATVDTQRQVSDSEQHIERVNAKLNYLLSQSNSGSSQSPELDQDETRGKDLPSQLSFSTDLLERLERRVKTLVEQKDILTRQIQQQRELNSKSDAQRDAKIVELTEQLERTNQLHEASGQESEQTARQLNMLVDQVDQARQQTVLLEQKHGSAQQELEEQRGLHSQTVEKLREAHRDELDNQKSVHQQELDKTREEADRLQSEVVRFQTELTMARAELDGAYGSRAQRAAEMSTELSKKNEELEEQINSLHMELKETIEDYEVMTKQSIDFEKERDRLEDKIDQLERQCESLNSQLHEEQVKAMGAAAAAPNDTTSIAVLKGEFKKMMRQARAEHLKSFKAEQDERRRLEGVIRAMRKDTGQTMPVKRLALNGVNGVNGATLAP